MRWDSEQSKTSQQHLALCCKRHGAILGTIPHCSALPRTCQSTDLAAVGVGKPWGCEEGASAGPGVLGIHSGQEQEDNSPLLGTQSWGRSGILPRAGTWSTCGPWEGAAVARAEACDRIRAARTENRDSVMGDSGVIQPALGWR